MKSTDRKAATFARKGIAAALTTASMMGAYAGAISVAVDQPGPYPAGSLLTLRLVDANPSQMCQAGVCAADLRLSFDPALLQFESLGPLAPQLEALSPLALAGPQTGGGALGAYVDVQWLAVELDTSTSMPGSLTEILSASFRVLSAAAGHTRIVIGPFEVEPGTAPSYAFEPIASPALSLVPEPQANAMLLAGLGAWMLYGRRAAASRRCA